MFYFNHFNQLVTGYLDLLGKLCLEVEHIHSHGVDGPIVNAKFIEMLNGLFEKRAVQ